MLSRRRSAEPWNLNIHYDRVLAELARPGDRVLDVGCGDGFMSARLAAKGCRVTALDADSEVLDRARARWGNADIEWVQGDVMTYSFERASYDVVVSNATLHHLPDTGEALARLAELLAPGGRLGVVGFARNGLPDWPRSLIGAVGIFVAVRWRGKWEHTAPIVWPPALTYGQTRRVAYRELRGCVFRKLWLGRFWLEWSRPAGEMSVAD